MIDITTVRRNSENVFRRSWSRIKGIVIYVMLAILFVSVALTIAIVYTGKQNFKSEHVERHMELEEVGQPVLIEVYPFLAAVYSVNPYLFLCSAVILSERYLLTSANCFTVLFPNTVIRTGSSVWNEGGTEYEVEKFVVHEKYDSRNFENNVAIIKVKTSIVFDDVTQISKIHKSEKPLKGVAVMVGWGNVHNELIEADLKKCYENFCIPSSSVCDKGLSGIVVANSKLAAIWSFGDIEENRKMILTAVAPYKTWIQAKMND